jgi:hypothetical protein
MSLMAVVIREDWCNDIKHVIRGITWLLGPTWSIPQAQFLDNYSRQYIFDNLQFRILFSPRHLIQSARDLLSVQITNKKLLFSVNVDQNVCVLKRFASVFLPKILIIFTSVAKVQV